MAKPNPEGPRGLFAVARFFAGFLSALSVLLSVRYPVVVEHLLPMYRVDRIEGIAQSSLLTAISFASAFTFLVCFFNEKTMRRSWLTVKRLMACGLILLSLSVVASIMHFLLIHVSTRVANGILAAAPLASIDLLARDAEQELRDPATSMSKAYAAATEFIGVEGAEELPEDYVLDTVEDPPFRIALLGTFELTVLTFRSGLLFLAFALYRYQHWPRRILGYRCQLDSRHIRRTEEPGQQTATHQALVR